MENKNKVGKVNEAGRLTLELGKVIDLAELLKGKASYPSWSSGKEYYLSTECCGDTIIVSYKHGGNKIPKRAFPRYLKITPKLLWFFGFIYGEGSKSKGSSAYRRFTITNSDSKPMTLSLDVLETTGILKRSDIPKRSIKIARSSLHDDVKLLVFWGKELNIPKEKFYMAPKHDENKTTEHGVCHIFISDVLLRRVMDELSNYIFEEVKMAEK